jgi:hypothetical protein
MVWQLEWWMDHAWVPSAVACVLSVASILLWRWQWFRMWRLTIALTFGLIAVSIGLVRLMHRALTFDPVPDAQGIIHHPLYGDYPAHVPYHPGMSILPGQSADVGVILELQPDDRLGDEDDEPCEDDDPRNRRILQ